MADVAPDYTHDAGAFLVHKSPAQARRADSVLLILNQPIASTRILRRVWHATERRWCADGGANRLFEAFDDDHERVQHVGLMHDL